MQTIRDYAGHSLPLNVLFLVLNVAGLGLTMLGFQEAFHEYKLLFVSIGIALLLFTGVGLVFFKGKLLVASFSRILVGSVFIFSGLIKLNDPIGFAYKLEEYFQDGALAYRIKEWFGAPGFSLENLIPHALGIGIFLCVLELVIGVLLIINGKMRLTSWLLLIVMLFFTFLTWHTADCKANTRFTDRDTYEINSSMAILKMDQAKTSKDVKIIEKSATEVVVDEIKTPQCVTDCGCFGDALKGSVGRSLTPNESFWKDIILLYLSAWIFLAQKRLPPNTVGQNWKLIPIALVLIAALSWLFGWYMPIVFAFAAFIIGLWVYQSRIPWINNHFGTSLVVILLGLGVSWYTLRYDPMVDYRPWKVGTYLPKQTTNGFKGKFVTMLYYKNTHTGEIKSFDAFSKEYQNSQIWDQKDTWKFQKSIQQAIIPNRLASIDTVEFNPSRNWKTLDSYEMQLPFVAKQLKNKVVDGLKLRDLHTKETKVIPLIAYNEEAYPVDTYEIIDTLETENTELNEVFARDFILKGGRVLMIVSRNLNEFNTANMDAWRKLCVDAEKDGTIVVLVSSADDEDLIAFKKKHRLKLAAFSNDEITLKAIVRSNPGLLAIEYGWVKGKYTSADLPTYAWLKNNVLTKKK